MKLDDVLKQEEYLFEDATDAAGSSEPVGSVDVAMILSCANGECAHHGSHDPNVGGSMACTKMFGHCSCWMKPNDAGEPRSPEKGTNE